MLVKFREPRWRSEGSFQRPNSSADFPTACSRLIRVASTHVLLTSTMRPVSGSVNATRFADAWKMLENFSSLSRSVSSAALRASMSRTDVRTRRCPAIVHECSATSVQKTWPLERRLRHRLVGATIRDAYRQRFVRGVSKHRSGAFIDREFHSPRAGGLRRPIAGTRRARFAGSHGTLAR